ncbi:MAG: glutamine--fructose-6-phosphate transaminase (isomerizing) [Candidatus Jettenia sp.]|uniref:Glutamine--fructose-6-phosphate aminotransferase [isomerizing] n=1 Tax=Candidatus Jettenia caeni TaxID=247490 RepID=I3IHH6_9BACT|nr:glutamine--fructose-6-phosphate transaminase (isomerizing) [Candidatus Jettenia sp. AMX1]MBC6929865.1 glutamine--fructose-6-phosphate transaminase (isomerizing) [Candidatus Jettenia sp.]GAB61171.1 glucosamine/fructose-6-phosphate aminotransferase [Candidatus Jettenia caeni]KAA0248644.1 MAG: glutamine--fructose-6-phosphate transaminase (isomerizing) [Candidatus Jettenia sp. AMX1]MCE7881506.1 glutamine--fructose-6-phosphate transaminase (isomerizing) [Candidatus Jettenia sp. AMX1]MCQ3928123.1
MCGIVGYIGCKEAVKVLLDGIKRLEYRGYDSSGMAFIQNGILHCEKAVGKIAELEKRLNGNNFHTSLGIVHTRWATHGAPTTENAHPHVDCNNEIAVVHNGIIENYDYLKSKLEQEGHIFKSETDTEVLAHLIEKYFHGDLETAVMEALREVEGTYGIAVISQKNPRKIVAARKGSPLMIGIGNQEYFITSDVSASLEHTRDVVYLDDNEIAILTPDRYETKTIQNIRTHKKVEEILWNLDMIEKGGYEHFMLKEIHEQPQSLRNVMRGRVESNNDSVRLGGLIHCEQDLRQARRIIIVACGTSWHAGLVGEYMLEEFARIPVEVEYASEFRYRNPVIEKDTIVIAISQSGETADTLAAIREARQKGAKILSICNVVGSTIAREADGGIYLHIGPEIGVASTKAFTAQIAVLYLFTSYMRNLRCPSSPLDSNMIKDIQSIPEKIQTILNMEEHIIELAKLYKDSEHTLYLGRGYNYPVALEGALKLKEISYIHAEGYPAAEMKHGPIALINKDMPVVFIATRDNVYGKILNNIEEVKSRKGKVIAIATEGDDQIAEKVNHVLYIPKTTDVLTPLLSVIPLQLLAYHMAVMRGCDVDKPRNLAKSVTVE